MVLNPWPLLTTNFVKHVVEQRSQDKKLLATGVDIAGIGAPKGADVTILGPPSECFVGANYANERIIFAAAAFRPERDLRNEFVYVAGEISMLRHTKIAKLDELHVVIVVRRSGADVGPDVPPMAHLSTTLINQNGLYQVLLHAM